MDLIHLKWINVTNHREMQFIVQSLRIWALAWLSLSSFQIQPNLQSRSRKDIEVLK